MSSHVPSRGKRLARVLGAACLTLTVIAVLPSQAHAQFGGMTFPIGPDGTVGAPTMTDNEPAADSAKKDANAGGQGAGADNAASGKKSKLRKLSEAQKRRAAADSAKAAKKAAKAAKADTAAAQADSGKAKAADQPK